MTACPFARRNFLRLGGAAALAARLGRGARALEDDGSGVSSTVPIDLGDGRYLSAVQSHLRTLIEHGADTYGPAQTAMWMASLDTGTRTYPVDRPHAAAGRRAYRDIDSPNGSTMYWDQPQLVAAYALSRISGDPRYAEAADAYVEAFLARCVAPDGTFEWGNHRYYDAFTDSVVHFSGGPHEMRPVPPAWDMFWRHSPEATERAIRRAGERHVFDPATGGFNRHDDAKKGHAFLESGGILVESLAWLSGRTSDRSLADAALRIARFSFEHRDPDTGLVENNPTTTRWDKRVCTTEIGLWAGSLLRAADHIGGEELFSMARAAVAAYLKHGYDADTGRFFGQIRVADATPVLDPDDYLYQPRAYSDIWNALFPTHDYALAMAETCLALFRRSGAPEFGEAVHRWTRVVRECPPPSTARDGYGAYAEPFGRGVHFLCSAADAFPDRGYRRLASALADDALAALFTDGMFRTHAGEDRYDSVDGVGYLLLALLRLHTGREPELMGFGF